jgi:cell division protein FtsZ
MSDMGRAMLGTGEATGERRAVRAAEAAIANPLLDDISMRGARALLISITGGDDLTLCDVDETASRIRQEVDDETNIILGATFEPALDGVVRVSVVATGVDQAAVANTDVATEPLSAPVIAFPEPVEWRGVPAPNRSLLERLKSPLRLAS